MESGRHESKEIRCCIKFDCRIESNGSAEGVHPGGRPGGAARKKVTINTYVHDKYRRTLADGLLPNGRNVNHALVKDG